METCKILPQNRSLTLPFADIKASKSFCILICCRGYNSFLVKKKQESGIICTLYKVSLLNLFKDKKHPKINFNVDFMNLQLLLAEEISIFFIKLA